MEELSIAACSYEGKKGGGEKHLQCVIPGKRGETLSPWRRKMGEGVV